MFVCRNRYGTINRIEMKTTVCQLFQHHSAQLNSTQLNSQPSLLDLYTIRKLCTYGIDTLNECITKYTFPFNVDTKTVYCLNSIDVYSVYLCTETMTHISSTHLCLEMCIINKCCRKMVIFVTCHL